MNFNLSDSRFYGILDTSYVARDSWIPTYQALLDGGADLVQIRAKKESHDERLALMDALLPAYVRSGTPLIINDDVEAAAQYPGLSVGLHLGQDDMDPRHARERLGPDAIIGLSTHSLEQAYAAIALANEGFITYFAVGPLFATPTKPHYAPVGLELADEVKAIGPSVPFFCIGGITRETLPSVIEAGIDRIVVVSEVLKDDDPASVVKAFKAAVSLPSVEF